MAQWLTCPCAVQTWTHRVACLSQLLLLYWQHLQRWFRTQAPYPPSLHSSPALRLLQTRFAACWECCLAKEWRLKCRKSYSLRVVSFPTFEIYTDAAFCFTLFCGWWANGSFLWPSEPQEGVDKHLSHLILLDISFLCHWNRMSAVCVSLLVFHLFIHYLTSENV